MAGLNWRHHAAPRNPPSVPVDSVRSSLRLRGSEPEREGTSRDRPGRDQLSRGSRHRSGARCRSILDRAGAGRSCACCARDRSPRCPPAGCPICWLDTSGRGSRHRTRSVSRSSPRGPHSGQARLSRDGPPRASRHLALHAAIGAASLTVGIDGGGLAPTRPSQNARKYISGGRTPRR